MQVANAAIGYQETVLSEPIDLDVRRKDAIALVGLMELANRHY